MVHQYHIDIIKMQNHKVFKQFSKFLPDIKNSQNTHTCLLACSHIAARPRPAIKIPRVLLPGFWFITIQKWRVDKPNPYKLPKNVQAPYYKNCNSFPKSLSGVSQGSLLDPFLFNLFIGNANTQTSQLLQIPNTLTTSHPNDCYFLQELSEF